MGYINTEVKMPSIGDAIKQEDLDKPYEYCDDDYDR